ncbi:PDZ domain-containing protein [Ferruginibacter yonginensis]|uniref:PDZ domain-containing protein n=1 Tax=Ferruginibacter yonginensis TaxID=1310416 RepID=A0ABV8QS83_9BACT
MNCFRLFLLLNLLFIAQPLIAQKINRKGILGVGFYTTVPDSLAVALQYKNGVVIKNVIPNTTAAALGIQANDIITQVNNTVIAQPTALPIVAKNLRADENIEVTIVRNKVKKILAAKVLPKPYEQSDNAEIIYDAFPYKNGYVRTIYKTLKNKKPIGTIYFLQGLPCYSMDNFLPLDKTKQAIDALVERGFAVYRMEKADMGDNTNQQPCETMGFKDELAMYDAGYKNLLQLANVDTANIILFGHSMGGVTAPLLAQKYQPKAVVVYGTVFKPWLSYLLDANLLQPQMMYGESAQKLQQQINEALPYIHDYFLTDKTIEQITATPQGLAAMELLISYDAKTKLGLSGRAASVHKELNQMNVKAAWAATNSAVLAIYGECDIAAINADDHIALIDWVNKNHPGKGQFWLAPGTTHTFEAIGSMETFLKMQANQAQYASYAAARFNSKVFDYIGDWLKKQSSN